MGIMETTTNDLEETNSYAKTFIEKVLQSTNDRRGAMVIGLSGELGAGKTTFVKAVAEAFGLSHTVTSPTFVIEKIYKLDKELFKHLIHIDAYRLESPAELETLGWHDIVSDPKNIIFIEWADKVETLLPSDVRRIKFEFVDEHKRKIHLYEKS